MGQLEEVKNILIQFINKHQQRLNVIMVNKLFAEEHLELIKQLKLKYLIIRSSDIDYGYFVPAIIDDIMIQKFEYMFVFSKNKPKTFNPIKDRLKKNTGGRVKIQAQRTYDEKIKRHISYPNTSLYGVRGNIWEYSVGYNQSSRDEVAFKHPAIFPEKLVHDHIISWNNQGDVILDPFMGSGTTAKVCETLQRKWIGIEINEEYCEITKSRLGIFRNNLFTRNGKRISK